MGVKCLICGGVVPVVIRKDGTLAGRGCSLQGYRFCEECTMVYTMEKMLEEIERVRLPIEPGDYAEHRRAMEVIRRMRRRG